MYGRRQPTRPAAIQLLKGGQNFCDVLGQVISAQRWWPAAQVSKRGSSKYGTIRPCEAKEALASTKTVAHRPIVCPRTSFVVNWLVVGWRG